MAPPLRHEGQPLTISFWAIDPRQLCPCHDSIRILSHDRLLSETGPLGTRLAAALLPCIHFDSYPSILGMIRAIVRVHAWLTLRKTS